MNESLAHKLHRLPVASISDAEKIFAEVQTGWVGDGFYWEHFDGADGRYRRYRLTTYGEPDNEQLISGLRRNAVFWALAWWSSSRTGVYEFRLPLDDNPSEIA